MKNVTLVNDTKGVFGCSRPPCHMCNRSIISGSHDIRYVGTNTTIVKCLGGKKKKWRK
jgi:hypothetical protein